LTRLFKLFALCLGQAARRDYLNPFFREDITIRVTVAPDKRYVLRAFAPDGFKPPPHDGAVRFNFCRRSALVEQYNRFALDCC
jgi:hypothetical protein